MKLDSVRSLKLELGGFVSNQVIRLFEDGNFGFSAGPISNLPRMMRSISLGVGVTDRRRDFVLSIRLQLRGLEDHPLVARLVEAAKGEVDVRYIGRVAKFATGLRTPLRPLEIGSSIGHFRITAGTLGCFARNAMGEVGILSNNHVLADENRGSVGDPILQPGVADRGALTMHAVARLGSFVPLETSRANKVDVAFAPLENGVQIRERMIQDLGAFTGQVAGSRSVNVRKLGKTTGASDGRVTSFEVDNVVLKYDIGDLRFDDQIEIEGVGPFAFALPGDSGSLVLNEAGDAMGLVCGGSDMGSSNGRGLTYANPIRTVLSAAGLQLV